MDIDGRTRALWERDRKSAESLIASFIGTDLNPIGEQVLFSLIGRMSIEDAIRYTDEVPGLVATAVRLNPAHAMSHAMWHGSSEHQRGLFDPATAAGDVPVDCLTSFTDCTATTPSADFCVAVDRLTTPAVPAGRDTTQISRGKFDCLHRIGAGSTAQFFDG